MNSITIGQHEVNETVLNEIAQEFRGLVRDGGDEVEAHETLVHRLQTVSGAPGDDLEAWSEEDAETLVQHVTEVTLLSYPSI